MSASDFNLTGEEETVAKPKGKEYTVAEEETAKQEMTFYGSSAWCKMVSEWQKEHPITKKTYSEEEIKESDENIKKLNDEWKKIKEENNRKVEENRKRLGIDW